MVSDQGSKVTTFSVFRGNELMTRVMQGTNNMDLKKFICPLSITLVQFLYHTHLDYLHYALLAL